jgi:hypothetical protein
VLGQVVARQSCVRSGPSEQMLQRVTCSCCWYQPSGGALRGGPFPQTSYPCRSHRLRDSGTPTGTPGPVTQQAAGVHSVCFYVVCNRHWSNLKKSVCVYYCSTNYKAVPVGGGGGGGHVLRETTSRGLCGLVCPSRTCDRGGKESCVIQLATVSFAFCQRGTLA